MTYTYAYKTSDGARHEASLAAGSREEVFATLRAKGIKPIKVVAADGSKANGEIRGVRKRVVVGIALAAALVVGILAFFAGESNNQAIKKPNNPLASPRHQIYGDPAVVEAFERGHFEDILPNRLDRMLAWFAQPGKLMCPKGTDPLRAADDFAHEFSVLPKSENPSSADFSVIVISENESVPSSPLTFNASDSREVRELKQIVNGLREELRAYLANGNGTPRSYWRRLLERTQQEMQIYERTRRELTNEPNAAVWEEKNEALRRIGLRTIPNPKDAD